MSNATGPIPRADRQESGSTDELFSLVYDELRRLASAKMSLEPPGQTLQATALVHEAYARLASLKGHEGWDSRGHFFVAAGEAMRRILVERARRKRGPTAGGRHHRNELPADLIGNVDQSQDLIALSEILDKLEELDPRAASVVKLRFFAGFTREQAADALAVSVPTVDKDWAYAKAWLQTELSASS